MSPWIDDDGGKMPVAGDTLVGVRLRDGMETPESLSGPASAWKWRWEDAEASEAARSSDIMAYRIHTPEEGSAS